MSKPQLIALWITIGLLLTAVGYGVATWEFWAFLGTYWAVGQLNRTLGQLEGIRIYLKMTQQDQHKLKQLLKELGEDIK